MPRAFALAAVVALSMTMAASDSLAQPAGPTSFTFVAQWEVPRAQWATFVADFDKHTRPLLEKMAAGGALLNWGAFEAIVHTPDGMTHGVWWSAPTLAGIEKTRIALIGAPSPSITAATSHRDYYLQTNISGGKGGSATDGYLTVSSSLVKPGQGQEWRRLFEKNTKPVLDDLVAKGVILGYSVDQEYVHTDSPGWRHLVTLTANIDSEGKIGEAFEAAVAKRTPEEQKAVTAAFQALLEPGAHRDMFARVIRHWSK